MTEKELSSLSESEDERTARITHGLHRLRDEGKVFSERLLYPELDLRPPHTYCIGTIKASELLPFFNTIIVDLRPLQTERQFQERYGLSVAAFTRYVEEGKIAVRVRDDYPAFRNCGILHDLLKREPPRSTRHKQLHEQYPAYVEEAYRVLPANEPQGTNWAVEYADWSVQPSFREVFANKFALVSCYFGPSYTASLVKIALLRNGGDPAAAYDWLHVFSRFRIYPLMHSLDGIMTLPATDRLRIPYEFTAGISTRTKFLPFEVGRAALFQLSKDAPNGSQGAMRIPADKWQELIVRLSDVLDRGQGDTLAHECADILRVVRDANEEVEEMLRRKKRIESFLAKVGGIGIAGTLSNYAPEPWKGIIALMSGMLYALRGDIAETAVKCFKSSHVVVWFDVKHELTSKG